MYCRERPRNSVPRSRSGSAQNMHSRPCTPTAAPPSNTSSQRQASAPSPPRAASAALKPESEPSPAIPVAAPSIPASAQIPPPASVSAPPVVPTPRSRQYDVAKLLAKKKILHAQRQADTRLRMEEAAKRLQEAAERREPSPLPKTPSPPHSPSPFRLATPPPPWEIEGETAVPNGGASPSPIVPPVPAPASPLLARPDLLDKSPHSVASDLHSDSSARSRGSSTDVQEMVQVVKDESDDDDMYLDPSEIVRPSSTQDAPAVNKVPEEPVKVPSNGDSSSGSIASPVAASPVSTPKKNRVPLPRFPIGGSPGRARNSGLPSSTASSPTSSSVAPGLPSQQDTKAPQTLVVTASQEGIQAPAKADREQLEEDALEWLKQCVPSIFILFSFSSPYRPR